MAAFDTITLEGSTGAGNITAAPWIALFDRRLTTSATTGFYVVYLFSTDLSAVILSLAFGTTQFEEQFGGPSKAFPRMRLAAARLQEMFNHMIPAHLVRGPIDLAAEPRQKLHYSYQQAAILSYAPYRIRALPEEPQLVADLQALVPATMDWRCADELPRGRFTRVAARVRGRYNVLLFPHILAALNLRF